MKYIGILLIGLIWGCAGPDQVKILVKNKTALNREKETVELDWKQLSGQLKGLKAEEVVVTDQEGVEIPSQVIFEGLPTPQKLIFQASVAPESEKEYRVKAGKPSRYPAQVYGRYVPERMDDYAWENNLVGHRMYGPALEATGEISNGIDVWVKRTGELLINEWYKTGDYHKDHGKGMDCYKVGRTLGAGALAPYAEGRIVLGNNYVRQKTQDLGPLRITFCLEYAPFRVGETEVTERRTISLDANSRFNHIEEQYTGAPARMNVAAGIVLRPEPGELFRNAGSGIAGYWEPQNNDNGDNNGHLGVGVIFPQGAGEIVEQDGHLLMVAAYSQQEPFVYYMGSAWSKGGVETAAEWFRLLQEEQIRLVSPLEVVWL